MAQEKGDSAPVSAEEKTASVVAPEASVPESTGPRKRKQVDFFAPAEVKKSEKLVIKEVCIVGILWRGIS